MTPSRAEMIQRGSTTVGPDGVDAGAETRWCFPGFFEAAPAMLGPSSASHEGSESDILEAIAVGGMGEVVRDDRGAEAGRGGGSGSRRPGDLPGECGWQAGGAGQRVSAPARAAGT